MRILSWQRSKSVKNCYGQDTRDGNIDIVKTLLDKGVDVNYKNHWDDTALSWAKRSGHEDIVHLLEAATMTNGVIYYNTDSSAVIFNMIECRATNIPYIGKVIVQGIVEKEIDLSRHEVAMNILEKATHFAKEECPIKTLGFEEVKIYLCRDNEKLDNCQVSAKLDAYSYGRDDKPKVYSYSNREEKVR